MRKAGELLKSILNKAKSMDTAYAEALTPNVATSTVGTLGAMGRGMPLHEIRNSLPRMGDEGLRGVLPEERNKLDLAYEGALYASNIGSRYALPLGGVVAGAVGLQRSLAGLYDLASNTPVLPQDQTNAPVGY